MMERRDFVGAMLALFAGVAMPEPVLEVVRLITPAEAISVDTATIDAMLKEIYMQPIFDNVAVGQRRYNQWMSAVIDHAQQTGEAAGRVSLEEKTLYFELRQ